MYILNHIIFDTINIPIESNPIHIASNGILIRDCVLRYISAFGVLRFGTIGIEESDAVKLQSIERQIIIMDLNQNDNVEINGYVDIFYRSSLFIQNGDILSC